MAVVLYSIFPRLTPGEECAAHVVEKYKNMLKDPESMKLRSNILTTSVKGKDGNYHDYYFFVASGNNSFGASVTSTVFMYDRTYIADMDDGNKTLDDFDSYYDYEMYLAGEAVYLEWGIYGKTSKNYVYDIEDGEKIAKSLGIKYVKS